nr:hypothetical protein [uncultured Duganella sp.]
MHAITSFDTPNRLRQPGIVAGVAVSLALHAVLLFGYRLSIPPTAATPARSMTVWLQPPKPPVPVAKIELPPSKREREPVSTRARLAGAAALQRTAEPPPEQASPTPPTESQAITLPREQDPLYADQQAKPFNLEEAKKTARKVASEKAQLGTLTAQLEAHPLYAEPTTTELAKKMEKAGKTDCLKSASGAGLLAPLFWALDKHCKF